MNSCSPLKVLQLTEERRIWEHSLSTQVYIRTVFFLKIVIRPGQKKWNQSRLRHPFQFSNTRACIHGVEQTFPHSPLPSTPWGWMGKRGGEEGTSLERLSQRHKERVQGPVAWNTSTAYEPATLTSWSFLNKSAAKLLRSVAMVRFSLHSNGAAKNITRSKCIFLCIPGTELKKKRSTDIVTEYTAR